MRGRVNVSIDWSKTHAAIWRQQKHKLRAVKAIDPVRLQDLIGIERQKTELINNTRRFLVGKPGQQRPAVGCQGYGQVFPHQGGAE